MSVVLLLIDSLKISAGQAGREASWEISKHLIKDTTHTATDALITTNKSLANSISLYRWNCNFTTIRYSSDCVSRWSLSCTDARRWINAVLHLCFTFSSSHRGWW